MINNVALAEIKFLSSKPNILLTYDDKVRIIIFRGEVASKAGLLTNGKYCQVPNSTAFFEMLRYIKTSSKNFVSEQNLSQNKIVIPIDHNKDK